MPKALKTATRVLRNTAPALGLSAALIAALANPASAAPGDRDTTFSSDGRQTVNFGAADAAYNTLVQADGKIVLVGGTENAAGTSSRVALARLRTDGTLDPTFGGDGRQTTDPSSAMDFAGPSSLQPDGRILVLSSRYSDTSDNMPYDLLRYTTRGYLDATFSGDGKAHGNFGDSGYQGWATGLAVQKSTGKILILGTVWSTTGTARTVIDRYNPNGSRDTSFGTNGRVMVQLGVDVFASALAVQPDGKIVVGGDAYVRSDDRPAAMVARFTANGKLDATFGGDGKQIMPIGTSANQLYVHEILVQADGRIALAGAFETWVFTETEFSYRSDFALLRYTNIGVADRTCSSDGRTFVNFRKVDGAFGIAQQADGKLVLAGDATDEDFSDLAATSRHRGQPAARFAGVATRGAAPPTTDIALARLTTGCSLDRSFSADGKVLADLGPDSVATEVVLQRLNWATTRIVAGGYTLGASSTNPGDFAAVRFQK